MKTLRPATLRLPIDAIADEMNEGNFILMGGGGAVRLLKKKKKSLWN